MILVGKVRRFRRELGLAGVLGSLMLVMGFFSPNFSFWDAENLLGFPRHLAEKGIMACGMTLIIMTGGIDLSVGSLLGLAAVTLGYTWLSWGLLSGVGMALLVGSVGGFINGLLITRWTLPPLVVTLATMALYRGVAMIISRAQPVSNFPESFGWWGQGYLGPIPAQFFVWVLTVTLFFLIVERTTIGRYSTAIGDNERAAHFAALPVQRIKLWLYSTSGLLCAVGAILYTSRVSTAKADAGLGWELEIITAVILGGTQITGGRGTILGTFLGVMILGVVRNGLTLMGMKEEWQFVMAGIILIVTAIANERMVEWAATR